ncbi:hypothetical protein EYC80_008103 [Monilinia laxa]|uniref:Uncharacterized protein n=1 Tax=Monilinia laxa TaxID=61186 RepID=A0A5N6JV30_MONLA|nr:hypothetical protein EYC80_008103 [Monilinia laxa]
MKPILCYQFSLKHLSGGEIGICGWLQYCKAANLRSQEKREQSHQSSFLPSLHFLAIDQYTLNYGGAAAGSIHTNHDLESSTSFGYRSNTPSSLGFFLTCFSPYQLSKFLTFSLSFFKDLLLPQSLGCAIFTFFLYIKISLVGQVLHINPFRKSYLNKNEVQRRHSR